MIDSYNFGKMLIDSQEYTNDLIIYPDRIEDNWWRNKGHELSLKDISSILEAEPEILIVGTGYSGLMRVLPEVMDVLKKKGIELRILNSRDASNLYNQLSKTAKVVAAFHLTC